MAQWQLALTLALSFASPLHAQGDFLASGSEWRPMAPTDAQPTEELREKVYPPAHLFAKQHIPSHSKFVWTEPDGVVELEANRSLRIALVGKGQKRWVELRHGKAANHEKFAFQDGAIRLEVNPALCLGAEGGAMALGTRIVVQACESDGGAAASHQAFALRRDGRIKSSSTPMCMNAQDAQPNLGTEIALGQCGDRGVFVYQDGMIEVRQRPDLHFNVKGGATDGSIVLWRSEASTEDSFELTESGQLRLKKKPGVCLNAQRGVAQGSQIIGWPCSKGEPLPNELFGYDGMRSVIFAKADPNLVLNVKGGAMAPGDTLVLWPAREKRVRNMASGGTQEL